MLGHLYVRFVDVLHVLDVPYPSMHREVCSILLTKKKIWRETTTGWEQEINPRDTPTVS